MRPNTVADHSEGKLVRTATDFDAYYQSPDPWAISQAWRRDRALLGVVGPYVAGKTVLELGCGEGHLTRSIFGSASSVTGIDISNVAIQRAKAAKIANARFETSDFLETSFAGYDVIAAIECVYYLSPGEQEQFFSKLASEHAGIFLLSAPIIGANEHRKYFTDAEIRETFASHGLELVEARNLNANRKAGLGAAVAAAIGRLPFGSAVVDVLPESYVYQRCYVARSPAKCPS
jgi:2-polyprenyl-3-methyl-5-hydroxy-6-metoxy-1,4-benzoquinol methylase